MLNQCSFIGNLTEKPEVRYTQSGAAVANFSVACNEKYKDKDGNQQEEVEFVRCVAWQRLAEICGEYLEKGKQVYVSGKMKTRKWQDQSGNDKYTTEIVIHTMKMLGGKGESRQNPQNNHVAPEPNNYKGGATTGEDVPF